MYTPWKIRATDGIRRELMSKLDDSRPHELVPGLWWVGFADYEAGFSNNPYLLVEGDEAVLFDPGPGHPFFRQLILDKIETICPLEQVRYVVLHHQDPDIAALVPLIEESLHPEVVIIAPPRTALFVPYYGIRSPVLPVLDGDILELRSGRRIRFIHLPYLHFAGNMASYDEKDRTLFTSDVFGGFDRSWQLFESDNALAIARDFLSEYVSSTEALKSAHEKLSQLDISRICPQHGSVITEGVSRYIDMLLEVTPGRALVPPQREASPEELAELTSRVAKRLSALVGTTVTGHKLSDLVDFIMREELTDDYPAVGIIAEEAQRMGVANPMGLKQVHTEENISAVSPERVLNAVKRRVLTRQFALGPSATPEARQYKTGGLLSVKRNMAIMFVDIRHFTSWCEGRPADMIVPTLSSQLDVEVRIINRHGGRVNKVLGDGVLAFFPENRVVDCMDSAMMMQQQIDKENLLPVGIGCAFGEVIMGDIGEERRLDFTLIGAPVNTAARLCDAAAVGEVCVDEPLKQVMGNAHWARLTKSRTSTKFDVQMKSHDVPRPAYRIKVA
jgi:class 3 adenylate cyclase/glyoxylase-like metal-dependent hydrolase (beta-lactamase superfamily II)